MRTIICLVWSIAALAQDINLSNYLEERQGLFNSSRDLSFDRGVFLTDQEQKLDKHLESLKKDLISYYLGQGVVPFSQNYLSEQKLVLENPLYSLIEKMPKGGLLHVHSASFLDSHWLVNHLTTLPNCYVYWEDDGRFLVGTLHFFEKGKAPNGFVLVSELREQIPHFNEILLSFLQMDQGGRSSPHLWEKFEGWFTRTKGLIHYKPAFILYYLSAMEKLIEDGIQYTEIRALNTPVYNLDGSIESPEKVIGIYWDIRNQIRKKYPFFDFKIIHTEFRNTPKEKSLEQLEFAYFLRSEYPNFVIGYDLVGEEDGRRTTLDYVETFLQAKSFEKKYGVDLPLYLHDGESPWAYNKNLYDAVLLNSRRIGHGLNLFHFPALIEKIKEKNICLEICPVSNQVLGYVSDLRMHPAAGYLKAGVPCVISSDDPGLFGYAGVSPDLWEAILAWDLDIPAIKKLFINSIEYSGMSLEEKRDALKYWNSQWEEFAETF